MVESFILKQFTVEVATPWPHFCSERIFLLLATFLPGTPKLSLMSKKVKSPFTNSCCRQRTIHCNLLVGEPHLTQVPSSNTWSFGLHSPSVSKQILSDIIIFKELFLLKILFILREGKGGRETSMCGCLSQAPYWGPGLQPRHVPWLGIEWATLWFAGQRSIHWATPAGAKSLLLICI